MANAEILIRTVTVDDLADFVEIFNQPRAIWGTAQRPFENPEHRRKWLEGSDETVRQIGAEVAGRLVGSLSIHLNTNPRRRHAAAIGMAVHDQFHGRGVGTALMNAAIDTADNWLNIARLELEVYTDNEPALALYRKFDFEIEGTLRNSVFRAGAYVDCYSMARLRS